MSADNGERAQCDDGEVEGETRAQRSRLFGVIDRVETRLDRVHEGGGAVDEDQEPDQTDTGEVDGGEALEDLIQALSQYFARFVELGCASRTLCFEDVRLYIQQTIGQEQVHDGGA